VKFLARKGPQAVKEILIDRLNIPFNRKSTNNGFHLTKEGGHSVARILHTADQTGKTIMAGLIGAVKAQPKITVLTRRTAVDLLTTQHHASRLEYKYQLENQCLGAYVYDQTAGLVETILADFTVLATGGVGRIFLHTTNSRSCIGSALAMAYRAGVRTMNLEYIQFTPPHLLHRAERRFLITEALRGEGARLVNDKGEQFMKRYDPRADLAPRDIVTRAILEEMLRTARTACIWMRPTTSKTLRNTSPLSTKSANRSHRHYGSAYPRGPGGPLLLRRPIDRRARPHQHGEALRRRGMRLHRIARGQPHGQHVASGMPVVGL
jgi:L-aspartate oxidase